MDAIEAKEERLFDADKSTPFEALSLFAGVGVPKIEAPGEKKAQIRG